MSGNMPYAPPPSPPHPGGGLAPGGPSRVGYWLGGGIIVVGVVAAIAWFVVGIAGLSDQVDGFQRVPFGGSGEVSFSEPGGYVLYYEGPQETSPGFRTNLDPLDGGETGRFGSYGSDLTYSFGGHSGTAVGTIEIVRPGRFRLVTTTSSDAGGELAVGRSVGGKLVATVVGGLALGFGSCVIGAITLIVTAVRRSSARKRR